jgi:alpha-galactosidase
MSEKIVLIGAGSGMFGLGSLGNILKSQALSGSTVVLHDIDAQALGRVERVARRHIEEHRLPVKLLATTSRSEALPGTSPGCARKPGSST